MSESDWNSVTRIGKSHGGGGAGPRETTIKNRSALNSALRTGGVSTEKKYGSANTKTNLEGQRATMVDRADDVVPVKKMNPKVIAAIRKGLTQKGLKQAEAAQKANITRPDFDKLLRPDSPKPNPDLLRKLERLLGVKLTGREDEIGNPLGTVMTKAEKKEAEREAARKKAEEKAAKKEAKEKAAQGNKEEESGEKIEGEDDETVENGAEETAEKE